MFCIVYGFSNAGSDGWHAPATWGFLAAGGVLLTAFGYIETRARQPLLPLRIVLDRNQGVAYPVDRRRWHVRHLPVAASAAASYLAGHLSPRLMTGGHPAPALTELAQAHSYTTAF